MRFDGGSSRDAGGERMKDFILVGKLRKKQTRNCMNRNSAPVILFPDLPILVVS